MFLFEQLLKAVKNGGSAQVITLISTPKDKQKYIGQMLAIYESNIVYGLIKSKKFTQLVIKMIDKLEWKKPIILTVDHNGQYRLFWDFYQKTFEVLVLGGGHISQPLVEFLNLVGFQVTIIDDRPNFANNFKFPKAKNIICKNFITALRNMNINQFQAAIIITRGHRHDLECLRELIKAKISYLGMIGSKRRVISIQQLLIDDGINIENFHILHSPIGLDIGAQTPAEIALSIAAEIIAVLRGGTCLPLSLTLKGGKIHG